MLKCVLLHILILITVYPSVEYDYVWSRKHYGSINRYDYLHIQWTGSDANNAGNAGNGMRMTDRHNLVETSDPGVNVPKGLYEDEYWERDIFGYRIKKGKKMNKNEKKIKKRFCDLSELNF